MSDASGTGAIEKENGKVFRTITLQNLCGILFVEGALTVHPPNVITFVKEGTELVSTVELQNTDAKNNLTYKVKEKINKSDSVLIIFFLSC